MSDDGTTKDDVKVPDGEVGDKINKLFNEENKDTSKCCRKWYKGYPLTRSHRRHCSHRYG